MASQEGTLSLISLILPFSLPEYLKYSAVGISGIPMTAVNTNVSIFLSLRLNLSSSSSQLSSNNALKYFFLSFLVCLLFITIIIFAYIYAGFLNTTFV